MSFRLLHYFTVLLTRSAFEERSLSSANGITTTYESTILSKNAIPFWIDNREVNFNLRLTTEFLGLLKWWPAGQIWPVAPLKVACGWALIKDNYGHDGMHHEPVKWLPYFGQILYPVLPPFQQPPPTDSIFFDNLNIKLKNLVCIFNI